MAFTIKPDQFAIASRQAQQSKVEGEEVPSVFGYAMGSPQEFPSGKRFAGDKRTEIAKVIDQTRNFGNIVDGTSPGGKGFGKEVGRWAKNLDNGPFSLYAEEETEVNT